MVSAIFLVRLLGQCLSNGRNDVLVGVPYASSYEFTEFLFFSVALPEDNILHVITPALCHK